MREYVPTYDEVRNNMAFGVCAAHFFADQASDINWPVEGARNAAKAQFDSWLAAEKAAVWDEGRRSGGSNAVIQPNPYREVSDASSSS